MLTFLPSTTGLLPWRPYFQDEFRDRATRLGGNGFAWLHLIVLLQFLSMIPSRLPGLPASSFSRGTFVQVIALDSTFATSLMLWHCGRLWHMVYSEHPFHQPLTHAGDPHLYEKLLRSNECYVYADEDDLLELTLERCQAFWSVW